MNRHIKLKSKLILKNQQNIMNFIVKTKQTINNHKTLLKQKNKEREGVNSTIQL